MTDRSASKAIMLFSLIAFARCSYNILNILKATNTSMYLLFFFIPSHLS